MLEWTRDLKIQGKYEMYKGARKREPRENSGVSPPKPPAPTAVTHDSRGYIQHDHDDLQLWHAEIFTVNTKNNPHIWFEYWKLDINF